MRLVGAVAVLLRRARAERATLALVFVLVALTSFAVAAAPRLFGRVADDGLRFELAQGTAIQRNLEFSSLDPVPAGGPDDRLRPVAAFGEATRDGLPPSIRSLIGAVHFVADTPRFQVAGAPLLPTFVTFREADGLDDQVDLVDGRWPERVAPTDTSDQAEPPTIEIALSQAAAERVGLKVGDRHAAVVDDSDPLHAWLGDLRDAGRGGPCRDVHSPRSGRRGLVRRSRRRRGRDRRHTRRAGRLHDGPGRAGRLP